MINKIYRDINYIYWTKESAVVHLTNEQFKEKVDSLKGYKEVPYTTSREIYREKVYSIKKMGNYFTLYLREKEKYVRYTTNTFDTSKNDKQTGNAIALVGGDFKKRNGITLSYAFGTVEEEIKRCIPKQLYYLDESCLNKTLKMSSIDGCSQYPANICGRLPDSHTAKRLPGTVKPTEEYPFAFYVKSGHCAEYGVFDTHDWYLYTKLLHAGSLFRSSKRHEEWSLNHINPEEDETVLMKASQFELTDTYKHFYEVKETFEHDSSEYQDAKLVLNKSIGQMHERKYTRHRYAHLVAIAISRANDKMVKKAYEIGINYVAQICVDGILYRGSKQEGASNRQFGAFWQEFAGETTKISSFNRFIALRGQNVIKAKWSGVNVNSKTGEKIKLEDIKSLDDQYDWIKVDVLKEIKDGKEKI